MDDTPPGEWLEPWQPLSRDDQETMERQLRKELMPSHPLFRVRAYALARGDGDDVLFGLDSDSHRYAVVHLVWQGSQQPPWPDTDFYRDFEEWAEKCMKPDHAEFTGPRAANESCDTLPLEPHTA